MALCIGQVLKGRHGTYRLMEALKAPTVFRAHVLPDSTIKSPFVVVKSDTNPEQSLLKLERHNCRLPAIASCPYIRPLVDVIGPDNDITDLNDYETVQDPFCLVLEWMEHDLRAVPSDRFRQGSNLPRTIAKSVLSALAVMKEEYNSCHTDISPNNIFLSDPDGPTPTVKVGDLGCMLTEGFDAQIQSLECRAPEVWRGLGVWHSSDVWSLGVTTIFGSRNKKVKGSYESWCIAKLQRLIGPMDPPIDMPDLKADFDLARKWEIAYFQDPGTKKLTRVLTIGTLREELARIPGPPISSDLIDFIHYLLVIDHTKRPTAAEALQHPYLLTSEGPKEKSMMARLYDLLRSALG
ncbi:MAG: hypothetical protein Q9207_005816 [Kuettlingeria erythrocarpa]